MWFRIIVQQQDATMETSAHSISPSGTLERFAQFFQLVLPFPAYSPDLNSVDYKFNHGMNTAFENRRFHSEEEIKEAVIEYIESKQPSFWHDAIYQLPDRWNYVVENEGKYYID
uniref:Transposase n=1 Tax=Acrobeloides nanus TaxID=290746 RepID=A0A914DL34_9BILA